MTLEITNMSGDMNVDEWVGLLFRNPFKPKDVLNVVDPAYERPLVKIKLPCLDNVIKYETIDDIPVQDVPCPCGDPKHWVIKYE